MASAAHNDMNNCVPVSLSEWLINVFDALKWAAPAQG